MSARYKIVRKPTPAQPSGTSSASSRPAKPKVTIGPRGYGRTPKGRHIVIRFFVSQALDFRRKNKDRWWVLDIEEDTERQVAKGTKKEGYGSQEDAVAVARKYRDEYGPYGKAPF